MPRGKTPEFREIASSGEGRDVTKGFVDPLQLLRPEDQILLGRGGGDYRIYQELLRDGKVMSSFQQRRLAVVSREWEVEAGGERPIDVEAADFLREQLDAIPWDAITDKMLFGRFYGFAVAEAMWKAEGSRIVIGAIKVRNRRRFRFAGDGSLRLITSSSPTGEALPDRKFWTFNCGSDHDDDPYGVGLAYWLYWPVNIKRNGVKYWLIYLEKFGQPTAHGEYPVGTGKAEQDKLLDACSALQAESAVITPEGMTISLIEAARSGTADYDTLRAWSDGEIAQVVVGQTLTSEAKSTGLGSNLGGVHMEVRQDLVKADADLVCASFNDTIAKWLTEWNFPGAETPMVWRNLPEAQEDLRMTAYRDQVLSKLVPIPSRYVYEKYGIPPPAPGEDLVWDPLTMAAAGAGGGASPSGAPDFAEAGADDAALLAERLGDEGDRHLARWVETARGLVERAGSVEEVRDGLLSLFPEMDTAAFAEVMRQALTAADLAGRNDAGGG